MIFRFQCSQCGKELECDECMSRMQGETTALALKPCEFCYDKATEPARLMRQAMEVLNK